ncbi:hypothetical protein SUGI_0757320 [Cryptomeria japonica]|nr:hypothetical protein SUGI_0757320 [Cryptomeria japonica]
MPHALKREEGIFLTKEAYISSAFSTALALTALRLIKEVLLCFARSGLCIEHVRLHRAFLLSNAGKNASRLYPFPLHFLRL